MLDFGFVREVNFNLEGGKFFIKWIVFEVIKYGVCLIYVKCFDKFRN